MFLARTARLYRLLLSVRVMGERERVEREGERVEKERERVGSPPSS